MAAPNAPTGVYRFNVADHVRAAQLLLINAIIGQEGLTFRYLPLHAGKYVMNSAAEAGTPGSRLARVTAVDDTLEVTATCFQEIYLKKIFHFPIPPFVLP